jgi:hypothetical protein
MGSFRVALVIVAGCSGGSSGRTVEVNDNSLIVVQEGDVATVPVVVTPTMSGTINYVVELDDSLPADFATLAVSSDGSTQLALQPGCSLVHHGGGDALVSFTVRTDPAGLAAPATVSVEIQGRDDGPCAPGIAAWLAADCSLPPAQTKQRIRVTPQPGTQQLCLRADARDDAEMLTLALSTAAPADRILIPAGTPASASTVTVPVGVLAENLRGLFDIDYTIERTGFTDPQSGAVTLEIGNPGDVAIDVVDPLPPLVEFTASHANFRVFEYATPESTPLCVRATRTTAQAMAPGDPKPFLRLTAGNGTDTALSGDALCSAGPYSLAVSPHVDSAPTEEISLVVLRGTDSVATTVVANDVTNVADVVHCDYVPNGAINPTFASEIACADINGDGVPEIVTSFINDAGVCLFTGGAGGRLGSGVPVAHQDHLLALQLATATVPQNVILGSSDGPPAGPIQMLDPSAANGPWVAAPDAFTNARYPAMPLDLAVGLAPTGGAAATHVAYPFFNGTDWEIHIRCVSCLPLTSEYVYTDGALTSGTLRLGRTGSGLSGAWTDGTTTKLISFTVTWSPDPTSPAILGSCVVGSAAGATTALAAGTDDGSGAAIGVGAANMEVGWKSYGAGSLPCGSQAGGGGTTSPATLGEALGVTAVGNQIIVGTTSGAWQAQVVPNVGVTGWIQRDPMVTDQTLGSTTQPDLPQYGSGITTCIGTTTPSFVTRTALVYGGANFLWSRSEVEVDPL